MINKNASTENQDLKLWKAISNIEPSNLDEIFRWSNSLEQAANKKLDDFKNRINFLLTSNAALLSLSIGYFTYLNTHRNLPFPTLIAFVSILGLMALTYFYIFLLGRVKKEQREAKPESILYLGAKQKDSFMKQKAFLQISLYEMNSKFVDKRSYKLGYANIALLIFILIQTAFAGWGFFTLPGKQSKQVVELSSLPQICVNIHQPLLPDSTEISKETYSAK